MKIKKVSEDNRGQVYQFEMNQKQHVLVHFNDGMYRGGHYHATEQWHICIAGGFRVFLHNMETGEESVEVMMEGDSLLIPAKVSHLFFSLGEGVLAESRYGEYEATDYEPQRKLARPQ